MKSGLCRILENQKKWYDVDKFLYKVPYEKVPNVYRKCHILIKSSILRVFPIHRWK